MKKAVLLIACLLVPQMVHAQVGIVNSGTAFGCIGGGATTISLQSNGSAFNTTGATTIFVVTHSLQGGGTSITTDNKGNGYVSVFGSVNSAGGTIAYNIFYANAPVVGTNHTWTIDGQLTSFCVIAISGTSAYLPYVETSANSGTLTTIGLLGTQNINHTNAFVISTIGNYGSAIATGPAGFSTPIKADFDGTNTGSGFAWKFDTAYTATENPTWTLASGTLDNLTSSVVFRASNSVNRIGHGPCTTTAATVSYADVASAVNNAQPGDVVCVPASTGGVATEWDNTVDISGGVEVRGAGTIPTIGSPRQTLIYLGPTIAGASLFTGNEAQTYPSMIDGIDFKIDGNSGVASSQGMLAFSANNGTGWPIIIHHNDYDVTNRCGDPILNSFTNQHGLFYRNRGTGTPPANLALGNGCSSTVGHQNFSIKVVQIKGTVNWASTSMQGSLDATFLNNVYVDTNEFHGFNNFADCSDQCRMVVRFNVVDSGAIVSHGIDSTLNGTRYIENYNNTFICNAQAQSAGFYQERGGTHKIFNNSYPASPGLGLGCQIDGTATLDNDFSILKLNECAVNKATSGWPGSYPSTYPVPHQIATGYNQSDPTFSSTVGQPQTNTAYPQSRDPLYEANNTYGGSITPWTVDSGGNTDCRAITVSVSSTATSTTTSLNMAGLVITQQPTMTTSGSQFSPTITGQVNGSPGAYPPYINNGQWALVTFADRIGGAAPTIVNACAEGGTGQAQTWTPAAGGTSGTLRLSAWTTQFNRTCNPVITITHASSGSARVVTFTSLRGLTVSPIDQNPAILTTTGSSFTNPATGTLNTSNGEIALMYSAVADFLDYANTSGSGGICNTGTACNPPLTSAESQAGECGFNVCIQQPNATSENGAGTTSANGVLSDIVFRNAPTNAAISGGNAMTITNRHGSALSIAGIITFQAGTNTGGGVTNCSGVGATSCLDLLAGDFLQSKKDYFAETVDTTAASHGTRASRPNCGVVGQGYWATDQGSWNTSGAGGNGVLDICTATGTPGTWTNAAYTPAAYPNTFEDVIGNVTLSQNFTTQPSTTTSGSNFSPAVVVTLNGTTMADSMTLSIATGTGSLSGTVTVTSTGGTPNTVTFSGVGISGTPAGNFSLKSHNNTESSMADVTSNVFTMNGTMSFTTQPVNTVSTMTMASFAVTTSSTSAVLVTLTPNNCGAGFTNLTATTSGGVATFSTVGTNGTGNNCNFVASAPNYLNVTSANFNITAVIPPPTQGWTQNPMTTQTLNVFALTPQITLTPPRADSFTWTLQGCATASLTGTLTGTSNNVTGIAKLTGVGVSGKGTGCSIKSHDNSDPTVLDATSATFNINNFMVLTNQPTNTASGQVFSPTILVTQGATSTDSLVLTVTTGTCTVAGTTTINVSGTTALWSGLAANLTGTGCQITIHDSTDANVNDIVSNIFAISAPFVTVRQQNTVGRAKRSTTRRDQ